MLKSDAEIQDDVIRIKKSGQFDTEWYRKTYKDVDILGMDPVEHYVKFGSILRRDPNPNFSTSFYLDTHPGVVKKKLNPLATHLYRKGPKADIEPDFHYTLWAASRLARIHGHDYATRIAQKYLPENLQYTLAVLRANHALDHNHESRWLEQINTYLAEFNVAPIKLKESGPSLLSRMSNDPLPMKRTGPKISVLMPAWNAEQTVVYAARSILRQTWSNLELIIVDDASEDSTWERLKKVAASDKRVKILRNKQNVGPYVSKNIALQHATGDYVTGQDADDWAVPQRLEKHLHAMQTASKPLKGALAYMVRIRPDGYFGHLGKVTGFSLDGVCRKASISCMFERKTLIEKLGYWDTVRFGADSEMISRAQHLLGDDFGEVKQISMVCLDLETSLTNHPEHGVHKVNGVSPIRANYRDFWMQWHKQNMNDKNAKLDFPQQNRRYDAAPEMVVPLPDIEKNLA